MHCTNSTHHYGDIVQQSVKSFEEKEVLCILRPRHFKTWKTAKGHSDRMKLIDGVGIAIERSAAFTTGLSTSNVQNHWGKRYVTEDR